MNAAVAGLSGELVWRALEAGDLDAIYALHRRPSAKPCARKS